MLRNKRFLGYMLTARLRLRHQLCMLAGTPFILQDKLGFSPREFGLIVLSSVSGFTVRQLRQQPPGRAGCSRSRSCACRAGSMSRPARHGGACRSPASQTWWAIIGPAHWC
jgi:DHA1 family bicyclomycin/chloramphenicol resistance-like MFS transporter